MSKKNAAPLVAKSQTPFVGELTESIAPIPKKRTVRRRTSVPFQLIRFARVNLGMLKMIRRSHSH